MTLSKFNKINIDHNKRYKVLYILPYKEKGKYLKSVSGSIIKSGNKICIIDPPYPVKKVYYKRLISIRSIKSNIDKVFTDAI